VVILAVLAALAGLVLLFFPLLLIQQHAVRRLVLGGLRPVAALRGGFGVLRANIAHSILLFLIQQGIALAGYTAIGLVTVILFGPAIVVLIVTDAGTAGIVLAAVTAVVAVPAALVAAGAVGTFGHGLWTLGYIRMVDPPR